MKRPWLRARGEVGVDVGVVSDDGEQVISAGEQALPVGEQTGPGAVSFGEVGPSGFVGVHGDRVGGGAGGWVVIVRGLPGVGKSTFVSSEIARVGFGEVYSPDLFFYRTGEYVFEKPRIGEAHAWCRVSYLQALARGEPLIFLDYPFIEAWQYEDYEWMARLGGYRIAIVEVLLASGRAETLVERNSHGVPIEVIKGMMKKWIPDPRAIQVLVD